MSATSPFNFAATALHRQQGPASSSAFSLTSRTKHDKVIQEARQWVGQTFFGPILKQAREGPFHDKVMDGGKGGEAFGSMLDQQIAQHITRGTGNKLVNAIVRKVEAGKAYAKHDKAAVKSEREGADRMTSAPDIQRSSNFDPSMSHSHN